MVLPRSAVSRYGGGFHLRMSSSSDDDAISKYSRRTARKRQRMSDLLASIAPPPPPRIQNYDDESLRILNAPEIDWESRPDMDPQSRKGGLIKENSPRGMRKRRQVEAFVHVCRRLLSSSTNNTPMETASAVAAEGDDGAEMRTGHRRSLIVDAGSGAGNLSIPLDGFLGSSDVGVLAVDVNEVALRRLVDRRPSVKILCADLATDIAMEDDASSEMAAMVVSLHACGAATDLAIRLATDRRLPFCMSPCCSAKAVVKRKENYGPSASTYRSSAPVDIIYPRSKWLRKILEHGSRGDEQVQEAYVSLAKVADIGLGPQTLPEEIDHQKKSKRIVEWDRLMGVMELHDYRVQMFRIKDHEGYAKPEIFIGVPKEMSEVNF